MTLPDDKPDILAIERKTIMNRHTHCQASFLRGVSVTALLAFSLLISPGLSRAADPITELFQKGLVEEEANRNLDAAIKVYEEVVKQIDSQRKLAATAVFRLGETYRKLGRTNDAVLQYRRILAEFAEEEALGRLSRQNLAGLGAREPGAAVSTMSPAARQQSIKLLREQIQLEEAELKRVEKMIKNGMMASDQLVISRRPLLELQRQLVLLEDVPASSRPADEPDGADPESIEIRRLTSLIKNSPDLINAPSGGMTPLQKAADLGLLQVVEFLLKNGAARDSSGNRQSAPIHIAAARGHKAVVEVLLKAGSPPSLEGASGATPLHLAAGAGHRQVVQTLIEAGANLNAIMKSRLGAEAFSFILESGVSPLCAAVVYDKAEVVELLLAANADVNAAGKEGSTAFGVAVGKSDSLLVERMIGLGARIEPSPGRTAPVLLAIDASREANVQLLLKHGADPNPSDTQPAAYRAVQRAAPKMLEILLASGAKPDAAAEGGLTPLHYAVNRLREVLRPMPPPHQDVAREVEALPQCIEILLRAKVRVDAMAPFYQGMPFAVVALELPIPILRQLIGAGMPVNVILPDGTTPVTVAVGARNAELLTLLLDSGADPNQRTRFGKTALEIALEEQKRVASPTSPNFPVGPPRVPLPFPGAPSSPRPLPSQPAPLSDLIAILLKHGALKDLADYTQIRLSRDSLASAQTVFSRGTNDWNQYRLYDFLAVVHMGVAVVDLIRNASDPNVRQLMVTRGAAHEVPWTGSNTRAPFPDFGRLRVLRSRNNDGIWSEVSIARRINDPNQMPEDFLLEWGDVVVIPELAHAVNDSWTGLNAEVTRTIARVVNRMVRVRSGGSDSELALKVDDGRTRYKYFNLSDVLYRNGVILTSSDLTRIKVTRSDGKTVHQIDLENPPVGPDLWLKDGDDIEIPNKK